MSNGQTGHNTGCTPPVLTITIGMGNDAFHPDPVPEVCRALRTLIGIFTQAGAVEGTEVTDANGNRIGEAVVTE